MRTSREIGVTVEQGVYFGSLRMERLTAQVDGSASTRPQVNPQTARERELEKFFKAVQAAWTR